MGDTSLAVFGIESGNVDLKLERIVGADPVVGLAAVLDTKNGLRVIRLEDREIIAEIPQVQVFHASFAADGSRLALLLQDSRALRHLSCGYIEAKPMMVTICLEPVRHI